MSSPAPDAGEDSSVRDSYSAAASNPNHRSYELATRILAGPPVPTTLLHLWEWVIAIRRRAARNAMVGAAPFTWSDLEAWSRFTGNVPSVEELPIMGDVEMILLDPPTELPEWEDPDPLSEIEE